MKRNKKKKYDDIKNNVDAIIIADLHISEKTPVSRTDDYIQAQIKKLTFLKELHKKYNYPPILDGGDIFDHWKNSPWLLSLAYKHLPKGIITVPGNHDLPEHSVKQYQKSSLSFLELIADHTVFSEDSDNPEIPECIEFEKFDIYGCPYGKYKNIEPEETEKRKILILHEMIWPGVKPPWPGAEGYSAKQILKENPDFDLIISGHNHSAFVEEYKGRVLVNPGSMMRISVDKADYKPRCYLYNAEENSVTPIYFPVEKDVHDATHINKIKEKEERLSAYIERINTKWDISLSFENNLESFFKKNKTPAKVRELIWEKMEK